MIRSSRFKPRLLLGLLCALLPVLSSCAGNPSGSYQKAVNLFATGDYEAAAIAFERLGEYQQAATYAAYSRGLVLFEKADYAGAEPYFEKSRDFMYGQDRYTYCHAKGLEAAGNYSEAAELYLSLGEFENAAAAGNYCAARVAEGNKELKDALEGFEASLEAFEAAQGQTGNALEEFEAALDGFEAAQGYADATLRLDGLQGQVYDYAMGLKKAGNFEKALNLFGKLGEYFDSPVQARECKQFFRDQLYVRAEALEKEGRLQEAYEAFLGLSGYSDAQTRAETLAARLGIEMEAAE